MEQENKKENAGCLGIGISFLIPLIGLILYFTKKDSVENASAYLYAALAAIGIGVLFQILAAAAA